MDDEDSQNFVEVTDLSDIEGDPNEPLDPLTIVWQQGGKLHKMTVEVKTPEDCDSFPIRYMGEKQSSMDPEYDADGKESFPHKDDPDLMLRRECVVSPKFLHNKRAKLEHKLGSNFFSQLHRRLMLVGGIDGDFFLDWAMLQTPKAVALQYSGSQNTSASSHTKSEETVTTPSSPPTTNMPDTEPVSDVSNSSPTTSGSAPQSPTSASEDLPKIGDHPHTQSSVVSSTPNPNPNVSAVAQG